MFYAGFARVDITPPLGSSLDGYGTYRPADAILDPLELNCIAFSDGENKAVLITADLLYVMEDAASEIRRLISKKCGIPEDHVFMQGLHQHTSLRIGSKPHLGKPGFRDEAFLDVLYRKYADVSFLALKDLKEATLSKAERETPEPLSFIRRYRMKDGSCKTNPGMGKGPLISHPLEESDNTVRLLRICRQGASDIALVNFSCHPDVIGGTGISADWPGFVRRYTEKALPDVKCILVNGAEGDSNHFNPFRDVEEEKKRRGYPHAKYMGKVISDTALSLWEACEPVQTGRIWGKVEMVFIPTNTKGIERTEECQRIRAEIARGERERIKDLALDRNTSRIANLQRELLFQKVPVSVLCLGKAGFVGFGGEPFTRYAAEARKAGGEIYIVTACLTNGGQGYLLTENAYEEGGFEPACSYFDPGCFRLLTETAATMLNEYKTTNRL